MTHCIKCHRPLKNASSDGYGPVCRKTVTPIPEVECDLFGFDLDAAVAGARERLSLFIRGLAIEAHIENRRAFQRVRMRLRVRAK